MFIHTREFMWHFREAVTTASQPIFQNLIECIFFRVARTVWGCSRIRSVRIGNQFSQPWRHHDELTLFPHRTHQVFTLCVLGLGNLSLVGQTCLPYSIRYVCYNILLPSRTYLNHPPKNAAHVRFSYSSSGQYLRTPPTTVCTYYVLYAPEWSR